MSESSVVEKFNVLEPKRDIQQNEGDYVSKPLNALNPNTWRMPGHDTENYGAARENSLNQSMENGTTE